MDYIKHILKKEDVSLESLDIYKNLFEMLSNQQEIKNVSKRALSNLDLEGEVSLIQLKDNKYVVTGNLGDLKKIDEYLEDRKILKHVGETKKPYFEHSLDNSNENFHAVLPIVSKDELLGFLIIHKKQEINSWDKIALLLHFSAFMFKYYNLISVNKEFSVKDTVTTLYNYRYFQDLLSLEIDKADRYNEPLSLLMVNIKNFRKINEVLGFQGGDEVLRQVGNWILSSTRRSDMPVRLDADHFAILMSKTNVEGAQKALDRILFKSQKYTVTANDRDFKVRLHGTITPYNRNTHRDDFLESAKNTLKSK